MKEPKSKLQDYSHPEHLSKDLNESNFLHKDEDEEDFITNTPKKRRNLHITSGLFEADLTILSAHKEGEITVIDKVKLNGVSVVRATHKP